MLATEWQWKGRWLLFYYSSHFDLIGKAQVLLITLTMALFCEKCPSNAITLWQLIQLSLILLLTPVLSPRWHAEMLLWKKALHVTLWLKSMFRALYYLCVRHGWILFILLKVRIMPIVLTWQFQYESYAIPTGGGWCQHKASPAWPRAS